MKLNTQILGKGKDLIILHGLYGAGDNWLTAGRILAEEYRVHLPDLRNHGDSPHHPDHSYDALAEDIAEYISGHNLNSPIVMGHSMGGKTAMWLSILYPELLSALIVVDISPVDYAQTTTPSALINQHLNIVNAMRTIDTGTLKNRRQIDNELQPYIPQERIRQFLLKSIDRGKDGIYRWKLNVEAISNYLPSIMKGIDIEKYAGHVKQNLPVLFIKGELSGYVPDEDADEIKKLYPQAGIETIFDSGHWIHAEKPAEFLAVVKHFLSSLDNM